MKPSNEMLSTLNNNLLKTSTAMGKGKGKGKGKGQRMMKFVLQKIKVHI